MVVQWAVLDKTSLKRSQTPFVSPIASGPSSDTLIILSILFHCVAISQLAPCSCNTSTSLKTELPASSWSWIFWLSAFRFLQTVCLKCRYNSSLQCLCAWKVDALALFNVVHYSAQYVVYPCNGHCTVTPSQFCQPEYAECIAVQYIQSMNSAMQFSAAVQLLVSGQLRHWWAALPYPTKLTQQSRASTYSASPLPILLKSVGELWIGDQSEASIFVSIDQSGLRTDFRYS